METPSKPNKLRLSAKGRKLLKVCNTGSSYSFHTRETLRLYEVGVLNCPTEEPFLDNYIRTLLKDGYLEEVPIDPPVEVHIDWKDINKGVGV
jgi:hypothetical protein